MLSKYTVLLALSAAVLVAASGCDAPPTPTDPATKGAEGPAGPGGPGGGPGGESPAPQPPDGFRLLDLGPRFLETNWGPDITEEQVPLFKTLTLDAVVREDRKQTLVREEELRLTQALIDRAKPAQLTERVHAFVAAERSLVEEQINTVLAFFDVFTPDQMATRLRLGQPPILVELVASHPMTGAGNPFARTATEHLDATEIEEVLRRKIDVHAQYLVYQAANASSVAAVGRLDLTQPKWGEGYQDLTQGTLDAWETYRRHTVEAFIHFLSTLPPERRNKFLLADGLTKVLEPAEVRGAAATPGSTQGAAEGAANGAAGGPEVSEGMGGPGGGPPGGPGGPPGGPGGMQGGPPGGPPGGREGGPGAPPAPAAGQ